MFDWYMKKTQPEVNVYGILFLVAGVSFMFGAVASSVARHFGGTNEMTPGQALGFFGAGLALTVGPLIYARACRAKAMR